MSEFPKRKTGKDGHRHACKACTNTASRKWRREHPERGGVYKSKWRREHPEKAREGKRRYSAKRRSTPQGKLNHSVGVGIWISLKQGTKAGRGWESLTGYSILDLMQHIERLFTPGMSWDNFGRGGWELDHIIPISAFWFETPQDPDFKRCWALKNLQPLWAPENRRKSNKLDRPFQPSLPLIYKESNVV